MEEELFEQTREELAERFDSLTFEPAPVRGIWTHEGVKYYDELVRVVIDVEEAPDVEGFFTEFKSRLKGQYRQLDIWITAYPIQVI